MSQECVGSTSATIYFRGQGAAEYEKFYTEHCPVEVTVSQAPTIRPFSPCDYVDVKFTREKDNYKIVVSGEVWGQYWAEWVKYDSDSYECNFRVPGPVTSVG